MTDPSLSRYFRSFRSSVRGAWMYLFGKTGEQRIAGWQTMYSLKLRMMSRLPVVDKFVRSRSVRLYEDTQGFNRILRRIRRAKFSIVIQIFIWKDDDTGRLVAKELTKAANRGVKISITKEAVGDIFEGADDFLTTKESPLSAWHNFWNHPHINITYEANRDHAKVFIFDQSYLLLMGMNIGDEYRWSWHDFVLEMRGSHYIEEYLQTERASTSNIRLVMNRSNLKKTRGTVMNLLRSATLSIELEQAYISDPEVLALLISKCKEGVLVSLVLPAHQSIHYHANLQFIDQLLKSEGKNNARVFLSERMIHGKVILVDQCRALVGSTNLMASSLDETGEVSVLLDHEPKGVLRKICGILKRDRERSEEITTVPYRPLLRRLMAMLGL